MAELPQIQWTEKTLRLAELRPFEQNPRTISEVQYEKLKQSLTEDGYHSRIKVTHDYRVVGGHQRLRALTELGLAELPVLVPSRPLSDAEFKRILIRDNHNNGVFDMDMLGNMFDLEELRDFGIHEVMQIPPMDANEEEVKPGKALVKCPGCGNIFPAKGNKHDGDADV